MPAPDRPLLRALKALRFPTARVSPRRPEPLRPPSPGQAGSARGRNTDWAELFARWYGQRASATGPERVIDWRARGEVAQQLNGYPADEAICSAGRSKVGWSRFALRPRR